MSNYSDLKNSWTRNSSLSSSDFNPFKSLPIPIPDSNIEHYYNTLIGTYSQPTNISPANSVQPIYYFQNVKDGKLVGENVWNRHSSLNNYSCK